MSGESYTLREVAELLGVSKRTLQRRIKDGAFPQRFLAPGRHGLETRIPAEDVQQALEELKHKTRVPRFAVSQAPASIKPTVLSTPYPVATNEFSSSLSMSVNDLEAFRDSMLETIREEREQFLGTLRDALLSRDRELDALRGQVGSLEQVILRLQDRLQNITEEPKRLPAPEREDPSLLPARVLSSEEMSVEAKTILDEIETLEALLGLKAQTPS